MWTYDYIHEKECQDNLHYPHRDIKYEHVIAFTTTFNVGYSWDICIKCIKELDFPTLS